MLPPSGRDIAIIDAGPVDLLMANLMGLAGHRVVPLERNEGLCPLPIATASDDDTLRSLGQIGLLDTVADGMIAGADKIFCNPRGRVLMHMTGALSIFRDAMNLGWKLDHALRGAAEDRLLDTYELERKSQVAGIIRLTARLGAVIMPLSPLRSALRHVAFFSVNRIRSARMFLERGGIGPPTRPPPGRLVDRRRDKLSGTIPPHAPSSLAWMRRSRASGVLVRPGRFIAAKLAPGLGPGWLTLFRTPTLVPTSIALGEAA